MIKKVNALIVSYLSGLFVFGYLTLHHFSTKLGLNATSLCQINQKINCDVAALSRYSELAGIPISVFGLCYSLVMLILVLLVRMDWINLSSMGKFLLKTITLFSAVVSVVLLAISIFELNVYCPFCVASYILSFINVYLIFSAFKADHTNTATEHFWEKLVAEKNLIITLALIPIMSWFVSGLIKDNYGLSALEKIIPEKIYLWKSSPSQIFDNSLGLSKGNKENPKAIIVEFADFKCPHCKLASQTLKNFIAGEKSAQLIYKTYPLDGACNPGLDRKGDGTRCELAGWALCAEKMAQKGWDANYWIFDHQEELLPLTDLKDIRATFSEQLGLNNDQLAQCATSTETFDAIKKMAEEGNKAGVQGTPTIYLNNKKLEHGQFVEVLRQAIQSL